MYEPQGDSEFIKEIAQDFAKGYELDMGCGTGIIGNSLLKNKKVDAVDFVDVNPEAVDFCKRTIKKGNFIVSDLFENLKNKKYDTITFNAPYIPGNYEEDIEIFAGKRGNEIILRFLKEAGFHLNDDGRIILLFSELSRKDEIDAFLRDNLFIVQNTFERPLFFEKHYVYIISNSKIRKELMKNYNYFEYMTKGRHSIIFTTGKKVIKVSNGVSDEGIKKEINVLRRLEENNIDFVPKIGKSGNNWFDMNFIEGINFDQMWNNYKSGKLEKSQVKKILHKIIDELIALDKLGIKKEELNRPTKNIIIGDKPYLIDFERTKNGVNLTEFASFLMNHGKEFIIYGKEKMIKEMKNYKKKVNKDVLRMFNL